MNCSINRIKSAILLIAGFICLTIIHGQAQFQRSYGTAFSNDFWKVIQNDLSYYAIGSDEPSAGAQRRGTISYLDQEGHMGWTRRLVDPMKIMDAVVTPAGDLIFIGASLPMGPTRASIIGSFSPEGEVNWIYTFDVPGEENLTKIVQSPNPAEPGFPYIIVGTQADSSQNPGDDDAILLSINALGQIGSKQVISMPGDNELTHDLEIMENGDMILTGHNGETATIIWLDKFGVQVTAASPEVSPFWFNDLAIAGDGSFYAVGETNTDFYLSKLTDELLNVYDVEISNLTDVSQVWEDATTGYIYVVGTGVFDGESRPVIMNFTDEGDGVSVNSVKYLDNGETSFWGGSITFLPPDWIAYTDGREDPNNGMGGTDGFISVSDLNFTTCMTWESTVDVQNENWLYNGPAIEFFIPWDAPSGTPLESELVEWQEQNKCSSDTCSADFDFDIDCGVVSFFDQSPILQNPTWEWSFPGGSPSSSSLQNPVITFPTCGNYTVCLTTTGTGEFQSCEVTICHNVAIVDNTPPVAVCIGPQVALDGNCEAVITASMIDGGSFDDCQIRSMTVNPSVLSGCGEFAVTLTVTDWCGNISTCGSLVETFENLPPVITCPANVVVNATMPTPCTATVFGLEWLSATDACGISIIQYGITGATVANGFNDASGVTFNHGVSTVTYIARDECGNTSSCSFTVTIKCIESCSANSSLGPELVANSGFNDGYNAFRTVFRPKFIPGNNTVVGGFSVLTSLQAPGANSDWDCIGHTTGSPEDKFLVCDGPPISPLGNNFWEQIVQVQTGRQYSFSVDVNNLRRVPPTPGDYDPEVQVFINSIPVTDPVSIPESPDEWVEITTPWISGINTMAYIELRSVNIGETGNDLAIDDVSFRECMSDTCYCSSFSDMVVKWPQNNPGVKIESGDTIPFVCQPGILSTFTGSFTCIGSSCASPAQVDWEILNPLLQVVSNGNIPAMPYFGLSLLPSYFSSSGVYTLRLTSNCGNQECTSVAYLLIESCNDPCPCTTTDIEGFENNVQKGFANILFDGQCKACFSPIAMNDCEIVEWKIDGISVGTSVGKQPFCYSFQNAGSYIVTLVATRKKSNGDICITSTKIQKLILDCEISSACVNQLLPNPQFSQGAILGGLNTGGSSTGWFGPMGNPIVLVNKVEMASDSTTIFLSGNNDGGDLLSTNSIICWPRDTNILILRTKPCWKPIPPDKAPPMTPLPEEDVPLKKLNLLVAQKPGESVNVQLVKNNIVVPWGLCDEGDCFDLASILLPKPDSAGSWFTIQIPYDLRIWDPNGDGGCIPENFPNEEGKMVRPLISITNWLSDSQGDSKSVMILDKICFSESTVSIDNLKFSEKILIYPNPNVDELYIKFPGATTSKIMLRIIDFSGKVIAEKKCNFGNLIENMNVENLNAGMYFLQILANNHILFVNKFVKM